MPTYPPSGLSVGWQRRGVWEGTYERTAGGLTKADLMQHPKTGKIISKKAHAAAKKRYADNIAKYGSKEKYMKHLASQGFKPFVKGQKPPSRKKKRTTSRKKKRTKSRGGRKSCRGGIRLRTKPRRCLSRSSKRGKAVARSRRNSRRR